MNRQPNTLSRQELVETVQQILDCSGTEEEVDEAIARFRSSVPHPEPLRLLKSGRSAEDIVEQALSYKPIRLPG